MLSLYFVCVAAIFAPLTRRDTLHRKSCRGDTAAGGGGAWSRSGLRAFFAYVSPDRVPSFRKTCLRADQTRRFLQTNAACRGGACFAKYTFAHMKMCAWLSRGKGLICGIFFRFCCVFVKRMIEFVKKLYFFVFLFIKKLTKHKGRGILYLTEIMTAFCVYADL